MNTIGLCSTQMPARYVVPNKSRLREGVKPVHGETNVINAGTALDYATVSMLDHADSEGSNILSKKFRTQSSNNLQSFQIFKQNHGGKSS